MFIVANHFLVKNQRDIKGTSKDNQRKITGKSQGKQRKHKGKTKDNQRTIKGQSKDISTSHTRSYSHDGEITVSNAMYHQHTINNRLVHQKQYACMI